MLAFAGRGACAHRSTEMEESPPPPVQQGDWIKRTVGMFLPPWALVRHVYAPGWIEVAYCTLDSVDKNDWKWAGRSWDRFADFGMRVDDRHGLLYQSLQTGPPRDLPEGDSSRTLPHTGAVVWPATQTEGLR